MAIKACVECGQSVSTAAKTCPHCGKSDPTTPTWAKVISAVVVCGVLLWVGVWCSGIGGDSDSPSRSSTFVADPVLQQERRELIDELISQGVFTKVEMLGSIPDAWVTPMFYGLDFETKQQFANVVFAYYFPDPNASEYSGDHVRLKDSQNGKTVGTYDLRSGLELQ